MMAAPMQHSELTCLVAVVSTQDETHRLGRAHRFKFLGGKPIEKLVRLSAKNTFSQLCDFPEVGESPLVRRINLIHELSHALIPGIAGP
jgi:hypothetical protein